MAVLRIRAPLACKIAGIDRDRFNEAVARGDYPAAPPGGPGRARVFTISQLKTLRIYALKTNEGMATGLAGRRVNEIEPLIRTIDQLKFDDTDITHNGVLIKSAFEQYRASSALDGLGVAEIEVDGGYDVHLTGALEPDLKELVQKTTGQMVVSPMVIWFGRRPVISQRNWNIAHIHTYVMREIDEYRNTLGEEEAIG